MVQSLHMPEEKRLRLEAKIHGQSVGSLIDGIVKKFGEKGLELITEVYTQNAMRALHQASTRGQKLTTMDEFLPFYLNICHMLDIPAEVVDRVADRIAIHFCTGLQECRQYVTEPEACLAMFQGFEKVLLRNLLPQWDADYTKFLQKGDGCCELVFYKKAGAASH